MYNCRAEEIPNVSSARQFYISTLPYIPHGNYTLYIIHFTLSFVLQMPPILRRFVGEQVRGEDA